MSDEMIIRHGSPTLAGLKTGLKDINVSDVGKYMVMSKMRKSNLNGTENAQVCIAHNGQMEKALNSSQ